MANSVNLHRAETPTALTWLLMGSVAVVGSNSLLLSPILADVARDLGSTSVAVARANAAYGGTTALAALFLGPLLDRLGPSRMMPFALGFLALAMISSSLSTHPYWLCASQALAGVAAGVVLPAAYALAGNAAPPGREAQVLGKVLTGWSVSLVAGVPFSAYLASTFSWRMPYLVLATILAAVAVGMALQRIESSRASHAITLPWLALRIPGVAPLLLVCLLFMTAFYGVYAFLGDFARNALDLGAEEAGLLVLAYGAGFGAAAFGDKFIDQIGPMRLLPMGICAVACVYASMLAASTNFIALILVCALWGVANHMTLNVLLLQLTARAGHQKGAVLALNSATTYLGATIGAAAFGLLYEVQGFRSLGTAAATCAALAASVCLLHPQIRRGTGK